MTVTPEQWAEVAAELGMTMDLLQAKITQIDCRDRDVAEIERLFNVPPLYYDRDLDPITLGQWAMLHSSRAYRFIRRTILPNRYWVATIWQGCNDEGADQPVVMESAAFLLDDQDRERLPEPSLQVWHPSLADALEGHDRLVAQAATLHLAN